ncbi:hypothetical protein [Burkholderia sp. Bp9004]|uniref:hypothetical protein n=1 Tax=Burkholderia sp. Bp9004 TaxID=2184559 RepID=UPI0021AB2BC4|nr:hypothetical protein [Burkholderia sp. Bp9004]
MIDVSIEPFFFKRQQQLTMQVNRYALAGGLLVADAGPWLLDWERADGAIRKTLRIGSIPTVSRC